MNQNVRKLVECSLLLAIASVLSLFKIIDLPYGGSVTLASILPVVLISYRNGYKWGLVSSFVYGTIQLLLGLDNLSYVTTALSVCAVVFLDYLLAFMGGTFGSVFKSYPKQNVGFALAVFCACLFRFLCHVLSGATVWAGLSIPTSAALLFSFGYNATYMIPEGIVSVLLAWYLGSILDFSLVIPKRKTNENENGKLFLFNAISFFLLSALVVVDVILIFSHLQNEETGLFDGSYLQTRENFLPILILTLICLFIVIVISCVNYFQKNKTKE